MTDSITPEQQSALRSAHEDGQIYTALAEAISAKAVEKFEERHGRNRSLYLTFGAIAFSLLSAGLTIVIDELLDARVARKVESAIKSQLGSLDFASQVGGLNADARRIEASKKYFSADEAKRIVDQIEELYEDSASKAALEAGLPLEKVIENRNKLIWVVEVTMTNLAGAKYHPLMVRLSEIAPEITERSGSIAEDLVKFYGRELIAAPAGAAAWTESDGARVETFKTYRTYALRAERQGFPELYIAFELLTRNMAGHPRVEIEQLAHRIDDLDDIDKDAFSRLMISLATQGYKTEPDSETLLVAQRVRAFLSEYADASETLKDIVASLPPLPG